MKIAHFFCLAFVLVASSLAPGQTKTIILVRHAEKAPATDTDKGDPVLSPEGIARADLLLRIVKHYKPGEIFSTEYKRTRLTVEPIAKYRKMEVQNYDAAKAAEFVQKIVASKTRRFVIAGHSNTIPNLANLIAKKEIFRQLPDNEYGVIWVIRLKNGVFKKLEIYPY